ncbi:MAG: hypothetical protein KIT07_11780, partial [Anaerolineales bacterium]|nr:hypothetical protein [Anaerolineales bacterium]
TRDEHGEVKITQAPPPPRPASGGRRNEAPARGTTRLGAQVASPAASSGARARPAAPAEPGAYARTTAAAAAPMAESATLRSPSSLQPVRVYPFGVARNRLMNAAKHVGVPVIPVKEPGEADVLVTLRTYYRKRQRPIVDAEQRGMPVYVLRANTVAQMERFLSGIFDLPGQADESGDMDEQLGQTRQAIDAVLNGERWVELPPASSYVRRLQHQMVEESKLVSHSYGKEPNRRVRIFRE